MRTKDLSQGEIGAIDAAAVLVYQSKPGGVAAVRELANLLRWEEYDRCKDCDETLPVLDGCCLVCGSVITILEEEFFDA